MVDSTPVECARSTETVKRSDLAGWAQYGYCASHSRYFWGLRLHLLCTVHGLPLGWALTGAKADERDVLIEILSTTSTLVSNTRESATIIGDKNYYGRAFEATLADQGITLLRPARKGETPSPGHRFFKPLRQIIESVNDTLKGQLDLEHHQGRTIAGVCTRIGQRILALTAAIWHNDRIGHTIRRSLTPSLLTDPAPVTRRPAWLCASCPDRCRGVVRRPVPEEPKYRALQGIWHRCRVRSGPA